MIIINGLRNKDAYRKIGSLTPDIIRGIRKGYYQVGKDLKEYATRKIDEPKHGRIYIVYPRTRDGKRKYSIGIRHQASAVGEYPAKLTGETQRSIGFEVQGWTGLVFGAGKNQTQYGRYIGLAPYAKYIEDKRPFLIRAMKERQQNAVTFFTTELDRSLKQNG